MEGTQVKWSANENVSPKNKAAHEAPRSQKYWDEHGIVRPDYAKTDAEIAKERLRDWNEKSLWQKSIGMIMMVVYASFGIGAIYTIIYGMQTGDWNIIKNNPVCDFFDTWIMRGHRLGSSAITKSENGAENEEERRRIARLARFEYQRDMLDGMKED